MVSWRSRASRCASEWNRPSGSLRALSTTLTSPVDMDPSVNASVMFPQLKLTPTRAAFARPGPVATPFPDVSAPMQPSDSLAAFGRRSGLPSPTAYLGAQGLFFAAAPVPTQTRATSETLLPRLPVSRLSPQGETRVSQVPGPSSSCVPWSSTPPGATAPRPLSVRLPSSSGELKPWTPGKLPISWLHNPRPTRSRTYASPNPLPSPAQGSLPARAGSPLAGRVSHPLDDKQGFMKSSHTPLLLDQPCLVALILRTNLPMTPSTGASVGNDDLGMVNDNEAAAARAQ